MAPEYAVDVERGRTEAFGDPSHLGRRHIQEDGGRIDEAADQPGAGDAVDLGPGASYPDGAPRGVALWQLGRVDHRQAGGTPCREAALQYFRVRPFAAE